MSDKLRWPLTHMHIGVAHSLMSVWLYLMLFHIGNHPNLWEIKTRKNGSKDGNETRLNQTMGSYSFSGSTHTFFMLLLLLHLYSTLTVVSKVSGAIKITKCYCCASDCVREVNLWTIAVNHITVTVWTLNFNCPRLPPLQYAANLLETEHSSWTSFVTVICCQLIFAPTA